MKRSFIRVAENDWGSFSRLHASRLRPFSLFWRMVTRALDRDHAWFGGYFARLHVQIRGHNSRLYQSYEMQRQLEGTVEGDELYHTVGRKGQAKEGGKKPLGRRPRRRRKKREPGRGHYDKDRPAIIAWVSRQGPVMIQAVREFTVTMVQKAADLAVHVGSRLYTDSASSYRALKGYVHDFVNHTRKEYARGEVHENRAECLFSLLKPYLRVFRGLAKTNLPGYLGFFQFLRNFRSQNAFEQAEMILRAALDPSVARRSRMGEFVTCFDHFNLLQTPIN
jgi:transposase